MLQSFGRLGSRNMAKDSLPRKNRKQEFAGRINCAIAARRSVDDGARVCGLGLTLSPGSQVQEDVNSVSKYDAKSPVLSSNGTCGGSPPFRSDRLGTRLYGSDITGVDCQGEPIGSISNLCECPQPPTSDIMEGKLVSALSSAHRDNTS